MIRESIIPSYICLFIATLTLSSAFAITGFLLGVVTTVVVSITWGIFIWRNWALGSILSMLIFVLGISLGTILEGSKMILLVSLLATLSTWDFATFHAIFSTSGNIANKDQLIQTHLLRLGIVWFLGLALPLAAFAFQFDLAFWQVFLLGILLLASLSQTFAQLRRGRNE